MKKCGFYVCIIRALLPRLFCRFEGPCRLTAVEPRNCHFRSVLGTPRLPWVILHRRCWLDAALWGGESKEFCGLCRVKSIVITGHVVFDGSSYAEFRNELAGIADYYRACMRKGPWEN
jgi:hypothetical protein